MTKEELKEKLLLTITEFTHYKSDEIDLMKSFEITGLDSMDFLDMLNEFQKKIKYNIPDSILDKITRTSTMNDCIDEIYKLYTDARNP